jgi:hypothetical protein
MRVMRKLEPVFMLRLCTVFSSRSFWGGGVKNTLYSCVKSPTLLNDDHINLFKIDI